MHFYIFFAPHPPSLIVFEHRENVIYLLTSRTFFRRQKGSDCMRILSFHPSTTLFNASVSERRIVVHTSVSVCIDFYKVVCDHCGRSTEFICDECWIKNAFNPFTFSYIWRDTGCGAAEGLYGLSQPTRTSHTQFRTSVLLISGQKKLEWLRVWCICQRPLCLRVITLFAH